LLRSSTMELVPVLLSLLCGLATAWHGSQASTNAPADADYAQITASSAARLRQACADRMESKTLYMENGDNGIAFPQRYGVDGDKMTRHEVQTCQVDASGSDGSAIFFLLRFGLPDGSPILLPSGGFYHWRLQVPFPNETVVPMDSDGNKGVRVTAQRSWAVFPDGRDVPHPPFHNHHSNYEDLPSVELLNLERWAISFGDSACSAADGGSDGHDCLLLQMQPGYCMFMPSTPTLDIISEHPSSVGHQSTNLTVYYELFYRLMLADSTPPRVATQAQAARGRRDALPASMFLKIHVGAHSDHMSYLTVKLPAGNSVAVQTKTWAAAGRVVGHHRWHSHQDPHLGLSGYIFSGDLTPVLERLGLGSALLYPTSFAEDIPAVRARLLEGAAQAGIRLLCTYKTKTPSPRSEPGQLVRFDLMLPDPDCLLDDYPVQEDEVFSYLCFNQVNGNHTAAQHCLWFGNFAPDGGVENYLQKFPRLRRYAQGKFSSDKFIGTSSEGKLNLAGTP